MWNLKQDTDEPIYESEVELRTDRSSQRLPGERGLPWGAHEAGAWSQGMSALSVATLALLLCLNYQLYANRPREVPTLVSFESIWLFWFFCSSHEFEN